MRRLATALVVGSLVPGFLVPAVAAAQDKRPYPWDKRAPPATQFARARAGRVDWAVVTPDGRVRGSGIHSRHRSASVVKAMLLVAYLNHGDVPRRPLSSRDKALLRPMITVSDNGAATRVPNVVGNGGLRTLARHVRMKDFATSPSWGSTQ